MPASVLRIRVLFSAPQDVEERDIARQVVEEIDRARGDRDGFALQYLDRRTLTFPALGTPQEVAAGQIGEYDVYVGVFWNQFDPAEGEPDVTTQGEFERALETHESEGRPHVLFYFCQRASKLETLNALDEKRKVVQFRLDYAERAGLAKTYEEADYFRERLHYGLTKTIDAILETARVSEPANPLAAIRGAMRPGDPESINDYLRSTLRIVSETFQDTADTQQEVRPELSVTQSDAGFDTIGFTLKQDGRARNACKIRVGEIGHHCFGLTYTDSAANAHQQIGTTSHARVELIVSGMYFLARDDHAHSPDGELDQHAVARYFWDLFVQPLTIGGATRYPESFPPAPSPDAEPPAHEPRQA
jgi:hypothetical protein